MRAKQTTAAAGELALIEQIRRRVGGTTRELRLGIGDDCALIGVRPGEELAVTTDLSIAGRHFRLDWHPAEAVGHRTLARGLSDLAAMGARPVAAFLSLGLPAALTQKRGRKPAWIARFYDGLTALAKTHRAPLGGGDLAESPIALADIVLVGAVPRGRALLRSGARPGDRIYVTGALGGAAAGLEKLSQLSADRQPAPAGTDPLPLPRRLQAQLAPHLYPQPRIAQGLWLQRHGAASAAMDLSDGLSIDLARLCAESGVAAEVDAAALPVFAGASLDQALHGGEDYELLFAAPATARIPRRIAGVPVTCVGKILRRRAGQPTMVLTSAGGRHALEQHGWEHFS